MTTYRKGYEKGAWFELKSIRETIAGKEAKGENAAKEWELYRAWIKDPGYAKADKENKKRGFYK